MFTLAKWGKGKEILQSKSERVTYSVVDFPFQKYGENCLYNLTEQQVAAFADLQT